MTRIRNTVKKYFPALKSRNYRLYFMGQGISLIGTWFASVAQQWLVYPTLTNNQSMLGIISAANLIPTALLVLLAGVYADRINKRKATIIVQSIFGLISFSITILIFTHQIQIWHIFAASLLSGIVFAFDMPTRNAMVVDMVEKKDLPSALSLSSGIFNAARAIGPAAAGILIATLGIGYAYLIDSLSFIAVIASLLMLRIPPHVHKSDHPSLFEGFKEGARFMQKNPGILVLLGLMTIVTIGTWPASVLLPVYAHNIFKSGEVGFGLMQSAFGAGAMVGAFGFSHVFQAIRNVSKFITILVIGMICSYLVFALTPLYAIAVADLLVMGWLVATFYSTVNTLMQIAIPNNLRGRMMGFYSFVLFSSMPIASLLTSAIVPHAGAQTTVLYSVLFMAFTAVVVAFGTSSSIRASLQKLHGGEAVHAVSLE